jgi:hypothetical protein
MTSIDGLDDLASSLVYRITIFAAPSVTSLSLAWCGRLAWRHALSRRRTTARIAGTPRRPSLTPEASRRSTGEPLCRPQIAETPTIDVVLTGANAIAEPPAKQAYALPISSNAYHGTLLITERATDWPAPHADIPRCRGAFFIAKPSGRPGGGSKLPRSRLLGGAGHVMRPRPTNARSSTFR